MATLDLAANRFTEARDRLLEAVEHQKRALATNPGHPTYLQFLSNHYNILLEAAAGLNDANLAAEARRGLAELAASDPRLAALDERLAEVLGGKAPGDNAECLALAQRAYDTERYAAAARLWAEALVEDPGLAEFNGTPHRYNAACAAALAGSGKGREEPAPDDDARAELRAQARGWLEAELETWARLLVLAGSPGREMIGKTLQHCKGDPDFAGVRGEAIDTLPEPERAAWRALWGRVEELLEKASSESPTA